MGLFIFRLERPDRSPADPPRFESSVPNCRAGDIIPLGRDRAALRVVETRAGDEPDDAPVLVVEEDGGAKGRQRAARYESPRDWRR
jgi:hypothetical protein